MAIMHPKNIDNYACPQSEKDMFEKLKNQLDDSCHVFYSDRWFDTDKNGNRIDSECDFLIFNPVFGFITIEVKGGYNIEVRGEKWFLQDSKDSNPRELTRNPYLQAENSMRHYLNYYKNTYRVSFRGVYGFAVAFPHYSKDYNPETTINFDDMNNLKNRINEIFHYWKGKNNISQLTKKQSNDFINLVNKHISLKAAAGALIEVKEREFARIDLVQSSYIDFLHSYKKVRIVGGAGTGKTFIGIKKAIRDSMDNKKVLFVCSNNKELSAFVGTKLPDAVDVYTYEELMLILLDEEYHNITENENGNRDCSDLVRELPFDEKYDSIIVDEAQDFDDDMGKTIRALLKSEESSIYVFYDKHQNIFENDDNNAFDIDTPPYVLRYNIRNTESIYNYAVRETNLGKDTTPNEISGVDPEVYPNENPNQTIADLERIVNQLVEENVATNSIVILSDMAFENSVLSKETKIGSYTISRDSLSSVKEDQLCFKTVEEFKGLEANVVIYLKHHFTDIPASASANKKDYVALTRPRYCLYILETKCKMSGV